MEKTSTLVNNVYTNAKEYVHLKTRSVKLEAYEKVSGAAASAVNGAVMAVLGLCAFLFINVGIAYALSDAFNSTKYGFLALGGIYVVLIGIFMAVKGSIDAKIKNKVVASMSKNSIRDYELMVKEKHTVDAQLERAETLVKGNIEELKENVEVLVEDFKRLKEDVQRFRNLFGHHDAPAGTVKPHYEQPENIHNESGNNFSKMAVSTVVELLINRFVVKDVNSIKKAILPILAKALLTTKIMNKNEGEPGAPREGGGGIMDTIREKLAKFL